MRIIFVSKESFRKRTPQPPPQLQHPSSPQRHLQSGKAKWGWHFQYFLQRPSNTAQSMVLTICRNAIILRELCASSVRRSSSAKHPSFNKSDFLAEICSLGRPLFPSRPRSNHDEIVVHLIISSETPEISKHSTRESDNQSIHCHSLR